MKSVKKSQKSVYEIYSKFEYLGILQKNQREI